MREAVAGLKIVSMNLVESYQNSVEESPHDAPNPMMRRIPSRVQLFEIG
jgi:hypothetical protein